MSGWKIFWASIGAVVGIAVIGTMLDMFLFTPLSTASGIEHKVVNPDSVLTNYEWYIQEYNDWQAINQKITDGEGSYNQYVKSLPKDQKDWSFTEQQQVAQNFAIVQGLEQQRDQVVADYNAKSEMIDRNLFKAKGLPPSLPQGSSFAGYTQ